MIDGVPRAAGKDDAPGAELGGAIGGQRDLFLVCDQQDRSPCLLQRTDDVDDVRDREHIDACCRFIEDSQCRFHRKDRGEFDPVTFAAAETLVDPAGQIALRVQANPFQGRFRILPPVAQTHVFTNRDAFESCRFLPGEREAQPGPFVHGERKKIGAPKEDLPGARLVAVASHEEISQGGLPRPIGSKQGMDFAGLHGEIESIENPVVSDLTGEAANV